MTRADEPSRRKFIKGSIAAGIFPAGLLDAASNPQPQEGDAGGKSIPTQVLQIHNKRLLLELAVANGTGISLNRIYNKSTRFEHLNSTSPIFELSVNDKSDCCTHMSQIAIDRQELDRSGGKLTLYGHTVDHPLHFVLSFDAVLEQGKVLTKLKLMNHGTAPLSVRAVVPKITNLKTHGSAKPFMAAIPQEAGGVASYALRPPNLGMQVNPKLGLPNAMNIMEVVSIYDPDGGGIFICDGAAGLDRGTSPIQFTLLNDLVSGYWITTLKPGEKASAPNFVIGVHDTGDWHVAVDDYVERHRPNWNFPRVPEWFRDQGAIYSYSGSGGGAIFMDYPVQSLAKRISSFYELPQLLDEAKSLGTNIVYLFDYWEGVKEGGMPAYWNKGDYIPRQDLGGEKALQDGISKIHQANGRIILYLEPYIIYYYSSIGKAKGEEWAGRNATGKLDPRWPDNYEMVACFPPWQQYLVKLARKVVGDWDADGVYLDSLGWELNWPSHMLHANYSPKQYSEGVLQMTDEVRKSIQEIKPDAIVMGESTSGALPRHSDGGLSADFAWLRNQNQDRLLASPVRYGIPEANIMSNGHNRNELHQIYAAGHNLALANLHLPDASYIRPLVEIRQKYRDALIYGKQIYQPRTNSDDTAAYVYRGHSHTIISIVNRSSAKYDGAIELRSDQADSTWRDIMTGELSRSKGNLLNLEVESEGLKLLVWQA
jgi:hypothetical protein